MKLLIRHIILLYSLLLFQNTFGQDTTVVVPPPVVDTPASLPKAIPFPADSVSKRPVMDTVVINPSIKNVNPNQLSQLHLKENPFFGFESASRQAIIVERKWEGKEYW